MNKDSDRRLKRKTRIYLSMLSLSIGVAMAISARGYDAHDYIATKVNGHLVHLVRIDTKSPGITIQPTVVSGGQDFTHFIRKWRPRAAINGGYFDADFRPLGDVVYDGTVLVRGQQRSAFVVTKSGKMEFRRRQGRQPFNWNDCKAALVAGPMLVKSGKTSLNPESEGFRPASRTIRAPRSAVGITADKKLLLAVVQEPVTLDEMAGIMLKLRASDAMNLDGGRSCALYADGEVKIPPASRLSSVLMIHSRKNQAK